MKTKTKKDIEERLSSCAHWLGNAEIASLIGKSIRTVEAYRADSDERTIKASDLMALYIEIARRFAPWPNEPVIPITVFDAYGQVTARAHSIHFASFISDVENGSWVIEDGGWVIPRSLPQEAALKSRLRRLIWSRAVTVEQACEALDCDEHTLIEYQSILPAGHLESPPEYGLRRLEALATERMGEAA
jgi:hypothetical protein